MGMYEIELVFRFFVEAPDESAAEENGVWYAAEALTDEKDCVSAYPTEVRQLPKGRTLYGAK